MAQHFPVPRTKSAGWRRFGPTTSGVQRPQWVENAGLWVGDGPGRSTVPGRAAWDVAMPECSARDAAPAASVARRLGAVVAGLVVVAGTTTVFDASSFVLGSAPPTEALSCNDSWTGTSPSGDWDSAANWSTGVPNGTGVDVCISGNANVTLSDAPHSVGELTVSAGSSLTIGTAATIGDATPAGASTNGGTPVTAGPSEAGSAAPSLTIVSGLQNDGAVNIAATGASDHPGLTLDGPITNTGTLTVDGMVDVGNSATALRNDGTIGVAPGGLINVDGASTVTNEPDGLLAFGINGPPDATSSYGRITNGTLAPRRDGGPGARERRDTADRCRVFRPHGTIDRHVRHGAGRRHGGLLPRRRGRIGRRGSRHRHRDRRHEFDPCRPPSRRAGAAHGGRDPGCRARGPPGRSRSPPAASCSAPRSWGPAQPARPVPRLACRACPSGPTPSRRPTAVTSCSAEAPRPS